MKKSPIKLIAMLLSVVLMLPNFTGAGALNENEVDDDLLTFITYSDVDISFSDLQILGKEAVSNIDETVSIVSAVVNAKNSCVEIIVSDDTAEGFTGISLFTSVDPHVVISYGSPVKSQISCPPGDTFSCKYVSYANNSLPFSIPGDSGCTVFTYRSSTPVFYGIISGGQDANDSSSKYSYYTPSQLICSAGFEPYPFTNSYNGQ